MLFCIFFSFLLKDSQGANYIVHFSFFLKQLKCEIKKNLIKNYGTYIPSFFRGRCIFFLAKTCRHVEASSPSYLLFFLTLRARELTKVYRLVKQNILLSLDQVIYGRLIFCCYFFFSPISDRAFCIFSTRTLCLHVYRHVLN